MEMLENDSCIRIRTINNKDIELLFDGNVRGVSLEVKDKQLVHMDVSQRDFIAKFMTDLGYYKYVSMSILRETYIKKDKEHYYSINIDTIADIGEFIDYDIYTDANSSETEKKFDEFESKISECIGESIDKEYRDYISKLMYNKFLKGEFLNRILVELEKIFVLLKKEIHYCQKFGVLIHLENSNATHFVNYREHLYGKAYYVHMIEPDIGEKFLDELDKISWPEYMV